ncbi:uncharacterized protein UV8b_05217 [Ustilaginoidea virens]|uniref:ELYS-like domain-containing protein n=1 Tax=Ustilaginoidea virens TaxID=1159556 RepID=A0A8E5MIQ3_USTVR|nr:uncharacterized protein UV8b_05217 [Ustilaginoidea virens]QUC20976.1 hypothetical protein UV8b_05217 [Ustilaginoidea virens]
MFNYSNFHDVFPPSVPFPYDRKMQQEIESRRKQADGVLFIDRVMNALGIGKAKAYPPKTENSLRQLHQQICETGMSMHHKFSLLYYLLLDFDDLHRHDFVSENFALLSGMPNNYQLFMKGLWYMDKQEYPKAVEYIAHPSLDPDFADDIIVTLVKHASHGDFSLALSYFYSVQPILKSSVALGLLFEAMTRTNVTEALLYSRTHPQHTREQLFRRWVSCVLDLGRGEDLPNRTSELIFMPFDAAEEAWIEEYLTVGDGRNLKRARDTLLMRKIACDRFDDVSKLRASGHWAAVVDGIRAGTEGQSE